jgi:hypothetical protein
VDTVISRPDRSGPRTTAYYRLPRCLFGRCFRFFSMLVIFTPDIKYSLLLLFRSIKMQTGDRAHLHEAMGSLKSGAGVDSETAEAWNKARSAGGKSWCASRPQVAVGRSYGALGCRATGF